MRAHDHTLDTSHSLSSKAEASVAVVLGFFALLVAASYPVAAGAAVGGAAAALVARRLATTTTTDRSARTSDRCPPGTTC